MMKNRITQGLLATSILTLFHCSSPETSEVPIYKNSAFSLYNNRVEQGDYTARSVSWEHMTSDYQSPANTTYPSVITFKFALNGTDNEMPVGVDHHLWVKPDASRSFTSPVITFGGQHFDNVSMDNAGFLPANTKVTIRVDLSPVLNAFKAKGYFEDINGNKLYEQDFNGVFIAGGSAPLSWDFDSLPGKANFKLADEDEDGIYTIDLVMNAYNPDDHTNNEWKLSKDISGYPIFDSDKPLLNSLYNLTLEELVKDIRKDHTFMAGAKWNGVWTRDISYSILLSLAMLEPQVAKNSLLAKVKDGVIIQDTGTGGSWPVSTDRMTWALAALEIYLQTGEKEWLANAYSIIKKSVEADEKTIFHPETGLAMGESSFLDWRQQSYPKWMQPVDIYNSQCLGTNAVHYRTYEILAEMAKELGGESTAFLQKAAKLKKAINQYLWLPDKGYYGQFLYGKKALSVSPRSEALGEALCILFDIADRQKSLSIAKNTPVLEYGIPCIYPQIPNIAPYHNNGIWPFVQAYWNWAMAKTGDEAALTHGLATLYRAAALFLTNKENMVAESGDFKGTEINSDRQLWSVAGNLASIYRIFLGMELEANGIRFMPFVPKAFEGNYQIKGYKYRGALLNISVKGFGNSIKSFSIDGKVQTNPFFSAGTRGTHTIEIELKSKETEENLSPSVVENTFSLATPIVQKDNDRLSWETIAGASSYDIYQNGVKIGSTQQTNYSLPTVQKATEFAIMAVSEDNYSFLSEPILVWDYAEIIEAEKFGRTEKEAQGYEGKGYIELSRRVNTRLDFKAKVDQPGKYWLMVRYSNGSGPVNTDNKCALRAVYLEKAYQGTIVMPQRGSDEWSNWGYSNILEVTLEDGKSEFEIRLEDFNQNMNGEENKAYLDQVLLLKAD